MLVDHGIVCVCVYIYICESMLYDMDFQFVPSDPRVL